MKGHKEFRQHPALHKASCAAVLLVVLLGSSRSVLNAQSEPQESTEQKIQKLNDAVAQTQKQLEQSQKELEELRNQLAALQQQLAKDKTTVAATIPSGQQPAPPAPATLDELSEKQAMLGSQIATLEQTKVESESKYPVKINGLLLFNGFVNTHQVDIAATPTVAIPGDGSTGASIRQTMLGLAARGPHLLGATSHADINIDFDASASAGTTSTTSSTAITYTNAYSGGSALLRLRTLHATLDWQHTQAYIAMDRPIISPDSPTSLIAIAQPALAWSGNLWGWNPQAGVTHNFSLSKSRQLSVQGALIDVADAPASPVIPSTTYPQAGSQTPSGEQSRRPGSELRIAWQGTKPATSDHIGFGGYFAPHSTPYGFKFNSWAASIDYRLHLPLGLEWTGDVYRGQALGGLGGGAYKDYMYRIAAHSGQQYSRALEDVGGWSQLKEKVSERLEFNAAVGIDQLFAGQLRPYAGASTATYQNLARNRTYTGNVIYSPSAYLLFSIEYRRLDSSPVIGATAGSNIIGLGAGYKF
jgi:hypothetical protein